MIHKNQVRKKNHETLREVWTLANWPQSILLKKKPTTCWDWRVPVRLLLIRQSHCWDEATHWLWKQRGETATSSPEAPILLYKVCRCTCTRLALVRRRRSGLSADGDGFHQCVLSVLCATRSMREIQEALRSPGQMCMGRQVFSVQDFSGPGLKVLFSSSWVALEGRQRGHFEGTSSAIHPNMGQGGWAPGHNRVLPLKGQREKIVLWIKPLCGPIWI